MIFRPLYFIAEVSAPTHSEAKYGFR